MWNQWEVIQPTFKTLCVMTNHFGLNSMHSLTTGGHMPFIDREKCCLTSMDSQTHS